MKVLLTAFNKKLLSDVMDFPENTSLRIRMRLDFDLPTFGSQETPSSETTTKTGEFAWDGKTTFFGQQEVRHYKLVNVS